MSKPQTTNAPGVSPGAFVTTRTTVGLLWRQRGGRVDIAGGGLCS